MARRAITDETTAPPPLWLVDWSDSEHEDFLWACDAASVEVRVIRGIALGSSVGTRSHRLRSWPTYISLALRGLRRAGDSTLIAWQPITGALVGLLRRRSRPRLVVLNPLIDAYASTLRRRILLAGVKRADRVIFFSSSALEAAVVLGLDRKRVRFIPLGVRPTSSWRPPSGDYFLAIGREGRDWETLASASEQLESEIRVVGPASLPNYGRLRLEPQLERSQLLELMEGARAIVVPLVKSSRVSGQLTVLDGISVGRAVIATQAPGVEDYLSSATGILVPPGDVSALREALLRLGNQTVAEEMGRAAFATAQREFSLERFVFTVSAEARAI
ncbi:MAG: glycosyltransferase [Gaiellaceae bacterium]